MNNLMMIVGQNIQYIRKSRGLTQEELAEKCEMQTSYLAGVERASRNITIQTLEKITTGLEVLPEDLFDLTQFLEKQEPAKQTLLNNLEYRLANCSERELKLITKIVADIQEAFNEEDY
ncbi:MAG: helix-turn-helix transcriptional regulator [Solibacillus isronensis]